MTKKAPDLRKIWRELVRPFKQLHNYIFNDLWTYFFAARYYDLTLAKKKCITPGAAPETSRVAIVVIYPSAGVQSSHLTMIRYFRDRGFAPLVVSNLPVEDHREEILACAWQLIERPNYGYDFGAYRDGVLHLDDRLGSLDQLVLINDSCWFPLMDRPDWLEDVTALNVDFAAAASNFGTPRTWPDDLEKYQWSYRTEHRNFHYCSFALSIGPNILSDTAFRKFWKSYPMTAVKNRTVRRGEIGLSQWVLGRGYSHGSTLDIAGLDEALRSLSDTRLREIANDIISPEDQQLIDRKHAMLASGPDRTTLQKFILATVSRVGASYALAPFSIAEGGFPFLKKSPLWLNEETSDISLRLIESLPQPQATEILSEARRIRFKLQT